ncbi:MAG: glycoside hydrolase family 99-like domain-containing protein [Rhizobacter sp.]
MSEPKVIAFHLPQYHEVEENNRWWGQGFTEWTNVRKAKPMFRGHRQPRVPADERYYDMMDPGVRAWQAELARSKGVHGFCYYHYWFNGRQLLEKPVDAMIESGKPDFPFCLAWANEPWTRAWDGGEQDVLMPQAYGEQGDWDRHFAHLLRAFRDPRYICVEGKPIFLIYRTAAIDAMPAMLARWRSLAVEAGLPGLHIVSMLTGSRADDRLSLFEARAEFEPMYTLHHHLSGAHRRKEKLVRHLTKLRRYFVRDARPHKLSTHDYASLWKHIAHRTLGDNIYPGAFADWDNSPRRGLRALVLRDFDKAAFRNGLSMQLRKARERKAPFLFFNAWNEWAEGTYLEPDVEHQTFFLDTIYELTR